MVGSGKPYMPYEEKQIVDFIIEHQGCARLKGNNLWQEMESHINGRTWQSLKERFRKQIYPNIHFPRFGLNKEQISEIRLCYSKKRKPNQNVTDHPNALPYFYDDEIQ